MAFDAGRVFMLLCFCVDGMYLFLFTNTNLSHLPPLIIGQRNQQQQQHKKQLHHLTTRTRSNIIIIRTSPKTHRRQRTRNDAAATNIRFWFVVEAVIHWFVGWWWWQWLSRRRFGAGFLEGLISPLSGQQHAHSQVARRGGKRSQQSGQRG